MEVLIASYLRELVIEFSGQDFALCVDVLLLMTAVYDLTSCIEKMLVIILLKEI